MDLKKMRGFTLVEVMMSVLIATLAFGGAAGILMSGTSLAVDNRSRIYAINGLRAELELFRSLTATAFDSIDTVDETNFSNAQIDKLKDGEGTIYVDAAMGAEIRKVTLVVSWTSKAGETFNESVATYVCRHGINAGSGVINIADLAGT